MALQKEGYKMIKAVIFDIDNTLYDYDKNHIYGMKALADYCESAFGVSGEEMKRCYKEAFTYDKAFSIIKEDSGSHFDPILAPIFCTCRPELEAYYDNCEK